MDQADQELSALEGPLEEERRVPRLEDLQYGDQVHRDDDDGQVEIQD